MRTIDLRGVPDDRLAALLPRPQLDISAALQQVTPIVDQVRTKGATALDELSLKFDGVVPDSIRVPSEALQSALRDQDPELTAALEVSIANAQVAHRAQLPTETVSEIVPGGFVYQRWLPLRRVGLYVPGGLAVYPSSVVMNVVPAQVAGVDSLVVASPPQKEFGGLPHPTVLAACALLGVDEVIAVGGAQAIAALAYGFTQGHYRCGPVDKVTGPGNIYVAAAKRAVSSVCGIDSEAGTTEIMILADRHANPSYVAADLISQAEHDPAAASVLVTDSEELAKAVQAEVLVQAGQAEHKERVTQALGGPQSGIVLVTDLQQGKRVVEDYGPEHLQIMVQNPLETALQITNAGAIFVGEHSPVPLGDYVAGSNHVLPTGGTSRYSSGLNTTAYLRSVQVIDYSQDALASVADPLSVLATAEGLPAHANAVQIRSELERKTSGIELPVREDLRTVEPYGAPQLDVPVRLNVNENPYAPSPEVIESVAAAVKVAAGTLNRYADRDAALLRENLAQYVFTESGVAVSPQQVWAANGSNEIMLQLLQAFGGPGRTAMASAPTYSMYAEYARDTFTKFCLVPPADQQSEVEDLIARLRQDRPAVLFIPSPNNPTGRLVPVEDLERILEAAKTTGPVRTVPLGDVDSMGGAGFAGLTASTGTTATIVVVDEAYAEFREPGAASALELLSSYPHLVVTRTLSKAFAAAGLRLGYMISSATIVDEVMKVRLPYHLSALTQAAANAVLDAADSQMAQVGQLRRARQELGLKLEALGFTVLPSAANFLMFGPFTDRHLVWQRLLDQGVLIREVGPEGFLRVTVGTDQENQAFLEALGEAL